MTFSYTIGWMQFNRRNNYTSIANFNEQRKKKEYADRHEN